MLRYKVEQLAALRDDHAIPLVLSGRAIGEVRGNLEELHGHAESLAHDREGIALHVDECRAERSDRSAAAAGGENAA